MLKYVPPFFHLVNIKHFLKSDVSFATKVTTVFENIILYFLAGIIIFIEHISLLYAFIIIAGSFLVLAPIEWRIIKRVNKRNIGKLTNWNKFVKKEQYYFLQYQLTGYIAAGYIFAFIIAAIIL